MNKTKISEIGLDIGNFPGNVLLKCINEPERLVRTIYEFELKRTGSKVQARHNAVNIFEDARVQILRLAQQICSAN